MSVHDGKDTWGLPRHEKNPGLAMTTHRDALKSLEFYHQRIYGYLGIAVQFVSEGVFFVLRTKNTPSSSPFHGDSQ